MRRDTELVQYDPAPGDPWQSNSTPIYQTATFGQPDAEHFGPYDYSRSGNPTRTVLERQLARLEGAKHALAYASGMAAIAAVGRLVPAGGRVLAASDLYGGTIRFLSRCLARDNVRIDYIDATNLADVSRQLERGADLLVVETPSNPLQEVVDLRALSDLAHQHAARVSVDNTMLSPYLQNPLAHGADIVVHSATKHLGGHGDLMAGAVITNDDELAGQLAFSQNAEGSALGPFEAWLLLRGMKTLGVRLDRQVKTSERLAKWLDAHADVRQVYYAGLPDHPGHDIQLRQARGAGSLLSFTTGCLQRSRAVVENTALMRVAVSFGSIASSISLPCCMSHASIPAEHRAVRKLPEDLVRISVGLEDVEDLIEDLQAAFLSVRPNKTLHAVAVST
ncbi:MAG: PLP-dependent aspartate aminotransferase family protein [Proteobacteria bacterium]|nr:PLP-dependent aspartate aminotransferase family protein [Pseudomonadota bacterium]